jgi:hypothetical protein
MFNVLAGLLFSGAGEMLWSSQPSVSGNLQRLSYTHAAKTESLRQTFDPENTSRQKSGWSPTDNLHTTPDTPEVQQAG